MGGKGLAILAGLLVLIAMYFLVWVSGSILVTGQGGISRVIPMIVSADTYAANLGVAVWAAYIILVCLLIALLAPLLILIGAKSRGAAIIGSIFPLLIGLILLLGSFNIAIPFLESRYITTLFQSPSGFLPGIIPAGIIPETILPFSFVIPGLNLELGALLLLIGGLLGLISGFMGRGKY